MREFWHPHRAGDRDIIVFGSDHRTVLLWTYQAPQPD